MADRFRVDRLVGTGGMAAVYQATDTLLGRSVAVKLFRADSGEGADPERQRGEVTVLASLNHFALVTLFDAGITSMNGSPRSFIVMEYVDGSDLRSKIASGPLSPAEVAAIGADISEALHYVHGREIIHRDVKPANVLLAHGGMHGRTTHAKLADFGIARLVDGSRLTATGTLLGTANYLSPEQALGSAIGPSSDVYSLGLVLLECLTAERSYPGTAVESAMARLQRQPEIPDSLGSGWADVLERMTRREPDERPSAEVAAEILRGLAAGVPVATASPGPMTGATKPLPVSADSVGADSVGADSVGADSVGADVVGAGQAPHSTDPADPTAPTVMLGAMAPADTGMAPAAGRGANGVGDSRGGDWTGTAATGMVTPTSTGTPIPTGNTATTGRRSARRSTRILLWLLALVVVAIAVVTVLFVLRPTAPETQPPPSYPAVDGPLGEHLQQLQESVNP
ncbi:serine/threonine-protein kinase [Glaciibacter superstes]|uniref:serine/threonine-protein kinase n=1 Tax=Glaciibacter superstes TaxID=501023 RepID=UPI003CCBAF40